MNRKGFTLIELLMVIVIIAILSAIMIPNIIVIINKNNENSIKSLENDIISSAKTYVNDNKYNLSINCPNDNQKEITLLELKELGYIKGDIKDPKTKESIDLNKKVTITFDCNTKKFTYEFSLNS